MPIVNKAADYYLTYRFIKTLVTPFVDTKAYELGIIDEKGKFLKKMKDLKTSEEKKAYGYFDRMVWNIKKILEKIPFMGGRFGSVSAASLLLLKEGMAENKNLKETSFLRYVYEDQGILETITNSVGAAKISGLETKDPNSVVKKKRRKRKRYKDFKIARR